MGFTNLSKGIYSVDEHKVHDSPGNSESNHNLNLEASDVVESFGNIQHVLTANRNMK